MCTETSLDPKSGTGYAVSNLEGKGEYAKPFQ